MKENVVDSSIVEEDFSRRKFIKGAALAAAGTAAIALAGCGNTGNSAAVEPAKWDMEADVVVVGSGNGGMSAAASAAFGGKKVIVVEVSGYIGGGCAYSGGNLHSWGIFNWADYNKYAEGLADYSPAKKYIETLWDVYYPWLQKIGAPTSPQKDFPKAANPNANGVLLGDVNKAGYLRQKSYFDFMEQYITGKNGTILKKTKGQNIVLDDAGRISGLHAVKMDDGSSVNIKAPNVVLACGGYQANKGMMAQYFGRYGDMVRTYGTPYNTGSGLLMGLAVGAKATGSFASFSGGPVAVVPGPKTEDDPVAWEKARGGDPQTLPGINTGRPSLPLGWSAYNMMYPERGTGGIFVNLAGQRFFDETSEMEKYARLPVRMAEQKGGRCFLIGDKAAFDADASSKAAVDAITAQGGTVVVGNSLEEFAKNMYATFGVYEKPLIKTIKDFNAACDAKTADALDVPRRHGQVKLGTPPYYGICATAGAYFTFGGLAINDDAQVLDLMNQPIPGLFACPPCAAMHREVYLGGNASAGTMGYLAGTFISTK